MMIYRPLGSTGIQVSAISFGAGPVSGLMTAAASESATESRLAVMSRALELGINWFDTAATYGQGQSERSLGETLRRLDAGSRVHVASKVRLTPDDLGDIKRHVKQSVQESLQRLERPRITLLQLHNSVTANRGDEPTSITPDDVLGPGGVLEALDELRTAGSIEHFGLTGIGQPASLREVTASGAFQTMQVPYHLLNPSAGRRMSAGFQQTDYGNIIEDCRRCRMGVFAIRVFAAGALIGNPPSAHTHKTAFFPLELYRQDALRVARFQQQLGSDMSPQELAVRFVLSHPGISSAIIGFGEPSHLDEAIRSMNAGPLSDEMIEQIDRLLREPDMPATTAD